MKKTLKLVIVGALVVLGLSLGLSRAAQAMPMPPDGVVYLPGVIRFFVMPGGGGDTVRFAVIGDYGLASQNELAVANLVKSWNPGFIITTGDNNYWNGAAATIDQNIGQYYHDFIYPYVGGYGTGATANRFFPSLGNHDLDNPDSVTPYLNYFTLPGNERYYEFVWGPVHFYALNSDPREPDGVTSTSAQARWLQSALAASSSCWNLVYFHHPPFSSGEFGTNTWMQWPFQAWGADAVLAGHSHYYERILRDSFPYFVNGLGGNYVIHQFFEPPTAGSQARYNANFGAMRVTATRTTILYEFMAIDGTMVDTYTQNGGCTQAAAPTNQFFITSSLGLLRSLHTPLVPHT